MDKIENILILTLALMFFIYIGYTVWFTPEKYLERLRKSKEKNKSLQILPDAFFDFKPFDEHPYILVWLTRISIIFPIILSIVTIITVICNP
ncbi:MAG: hypothetical protein P4L50_23610 [Anaerolineaceae bacterium]|nr:hypothetical protein [Anaerolineaceae bacterium]